MSDLVTERAPAPLLELPGGFPPDTISFATRTVAALMLAYYVSFWIQLSSASTAGVCVAIVSQPHTGGTLSKARYRVAGTVIGGVAAVITTSLFGQDRTSLLVVFTLWLAGCTFVASLLKDFRAYGAALAGYTLAIVSVTDVDLPQDVFITALDRVAAILVGVASLALVNGVFAPADAWQTLTAQLRTRINETVDQVIRMITGEPVITSVADEAECAAAILALRTEATYVASELQDGGQRAAGARSTIVALLGMLSVGRAIATGIAHTAPDPAINRAIDRAVVALRDPNFDMATFHRPPEDEDSAATLPQAFVLERVRELLLQYGIARDGFSALAVGRQPVRTVRLTSYHDWIGALLNAIRTSIVVGLSSLFCIYAGWSGATLMLVQIAAVITLLSMQPNPSKAGIGFSAQVPLAIVAAGVVGFLLLPKVGDFVPFTLAVAPFAWIACVVARHPRSLAGAGTGMLLWYVLLLAPTNPPSYDLSTFLNMSLELSGAMLAVLAGFAVVLPVSPPRRLYRVIDSAVRDLQGTLAQVDLPDRTATLTSRYDRFAAGLLWLGRRTPARLVLLSRIRDMGDLDVALQRAKGGLEAILHQAPALAPEVAAARVALVHPAATKLQEAGAALLQASQVKEMMTPAVLQAASGLYGTSLLLQRQRRFLLLAGLPVAP